VLQLRTVFGLAPAGLAALPTLADLELLELCSAHNGTGKAVDDTHAAACAPTLQSACIQPSAPLRAQHCYSGVISPSKLCSLEGRDAQHERPCSC
jgi:hypothetical protein